jgi:hypothetical protein
VKGERNLGMELDSFFKDLERAVESGDRKVIRTMLTKVMKNRVEFYQECSTLEQLDSYSQAMFHALILELDEEENESIEGAELSYLAIGNYLTVMQTSNATPAAETVKRRLLLLHYFNDYLTSTMMTLFTPSHTEENRLDARTLAIDCMAKMQLHDMCWLGEHYPDFAENDEHIAACDQELAESFNKESIEQDLKNAAIMHKALTAHLRVKYKNKNKN